MRSSYKTIGLWVILIVLFVAFYNFFSHQGDETQDADLHQVPSKVEEKKVTAVSVKGNIYSGTFTDTNEKFRTTGPAADAPADAATWRRGRGRQVREGRAEQRSG